MDSGTALVVRGVSKWYGGVAALADVDLEVGVGEIHGVVGRNGAGKTTLLSILLDLVAADEGTVDVLGTRRREGRGARLAGVAGFVEAPGLYPYLSGTDNLRYCAGLDGPVDPAALDEALSAVGLTDAATRKVRGYSLGMRQRLGLAACLLRRPRLLVLDEPTNGLDPVAASDLCALLRSEAGRGLSAVVTSHHVAMLEQFCDRVTVLREGRAVFAGSLADMQAASPEPRWHLSTADDAAALELGRSMGGLAAVAPGGGLVVRAAQEVVDDYVVRLGSAGIAIRGFRLEATPLEALFGSLTGPGAGRPA
jgi:ABC-2 type transport system ATP-binding protein